jgi:hypothetical protein
MLLRVRGKYTPEIFFWMPSIIQLGGETPSRTMAWSWRCVGNKNVPGKRNCHCSGKQGGVWERTIGNKKRCPGALSDYPFTETYVPMKKDRISNDSAGLLTNSTATAGARHKTSL